MSASIHLALLRLADTGVPPRERRDFEREVDAYLQTQIRNARSLSNFTASEVDDALAHALAVAARRGSGYRGAAGGASAHAWLLAIVRNHLRDMLRVREREVKRERELRERAEVQALVRAEAEERQRLAREVHMKVCRLLADGVVVSENNRHIEVVFATRWGWQSADLPASGDAAERRRCSNLFAQHRRRGRVHLGAILRLLVARGELDDDGARAFARDHGIPFSLADEGDARPS